jgi:hypothetical protein
MATKLNHQSFSYAKELVADERVVRDERDAWSEDQPTAQEENEFIGRYGWDEYARWHLGVDPDAARDTKKRYSFPYGDFRRVHRCGVLSAEVRAAQNEHFDIERAAARLHEMIDGVKHHAVP